MARDDRPPPLEDLDARLKAARSRQADMWDDKGEDRKTGEMAPALRVGTDLVAGVAVGTFIGWALDRWLGTQPWLMIVFFMLGAAAGFYNIFRSAQKFAGVSSPNSVEDGEQTSPSGGTDQTAPSNGTEKE
ncbi:MAG: AtpZ/AtpI family protein [Alphaproteobacteria bacterium]